MFIIQSIQEIQADNKIKPVQEKSARNKEIKIRQLSLDIGLEINQKSVSGEVVSQLALF